MSRERFPELPIVWGGYHATLDYRSIMQGRIVDYVIRGHAGIAIVDLAEVLASGPRASPPRTEVLREIPNLVFYDGVEISVNNTRPVDINELPPMNYDLLNIDRYFTEDRRVIQYVSSYGCPYGCTFCSEPAKSGRRWTGLRPPRMVDEISRLWDRYAPSKISFVDPNISTGVSRLIAFVEEMKRRGRHIVMSGSMRVADILRTPTV